MKNPLQTFGPNLLGRDFVIGDLHGAMPSFRNLCAELHFDPSKDRMFSVLDLVDRGPNSLECLQLLREPWFFGVLSNHEQMMLEAFTGGPYGQYWIQNGGAWGLPALIAWRDVQRNGTSVQTVVTDEQADIFDLVMKIHELPFLITLNHKSGKKFHILHAELPPKDSGSVTDKMLEDPEVVRNLAMTQSGDGDSFLWARYLFNNFSRVALTKEKAVNLVKRGYSGDKNGLVKLFNDERSMVISGHSIVQQPLTILGATNIDTCAYGSCAANKPEWPALTCIDLDTWTFYQATPDTFKVVEPITVNKLDLIPTESD